jgi:hypothetical protein
MEIDYYSKYLKYKSKYLELKKQMGGGRCNGWVTKTQCKYCDGNTQCRGECLKEKYEQKCICTNFILRTNTEKTCNICGHYKELHIP